MHNTSSHFLQLAIPNSPRWQHRESTM